MLLGLHFRQAGKEREGAGKARLWEQEPFLPWGQSDKVAD